MTGRLHTIGNIGLGKNSLLPSRIIHSLFNTLFLLIDGLLPPFFFILPLMAAPSCSVTGELPLTCDRAIRLLPSKGTEIRRADVFFFSDDSLMRLDAFQRFEGPGAVVDASSTVGKKRAVAVANYPGDRYVWAGVNSLESLSAVRMALRDEEIDSPVMTGQFMSDGTPLSTRTVSMRPLLAMVRLNSLRCDFSSRPYEGSYLDSVRVYIVNASAYCALLSDGAPVEYINAGGLEDDSPACLSANLNGRIGRAKVYPNICLYCYPNDSKEDVLGSPFTRLVVEGRMRGHIYAYPVNLTGLARGMCYSIDMVITMAGTDDPDAPLSRGALESSFTILPWEDRDRRTEVF